MESIEEVLEFTPPTEEEKRASEERVPLFWWGEYCFTVPKDIRSNIALRMLWESKTYGQEHAVIAAMEKLMGLEDFQKFMELPLKGEQLNAIMEEITKRVMGSLEEPGKATGSNHSQRKSPKQAGYSTT